ncbi:hypothetical protein QJS10_CPA07g00644 [Acorus calamus]|uniref:Uncharacterized protein n=1 Tax=Acorus calamus TaxID=4465 RepID=A0AAV9EE77_ACOCL|nr:hypothetical protein QJS10_CPA07g00644 [Acorus calamus]
MIRESQFWPPNVQSVGLTICTTPPSWPLCPRYPHTSHVALGTSTADSLPGPRNVQARQGILKSPSLDRTYLCALGRQTSTLTVRPMVIQLQVHKR